MMRILWLAPSLNNYKSMNLDKLAQDKRIELTVLSGLCRAGRGDIEFADQLNYKHVKVRASRSKFGFSLGVYSYLYETIFDYDFVLIPLEKKNILLLFFTKMLRLFNENIRIVTYNHLSLKSKRKVTKLDFYLTKFLFRLYDRVIFYSEASYNLAIKNGLLSAAKAFWANNALDCGMISENYEFSLPVEGENRIVFLGRLIESKRVSTLLEYYGLLMHRMQKELFLDIIGDGPDKKLVESAMNTYKNIVWHGALFDEKKISVIMKRASLVFVPGLSGLSINHAFAYGRPYITLSSINHGPEVEFIEHGKNGYILGENIYNNLDLVHEVLVDRDKLNLLCVNANKKNEEISLDQWVSNICNALSYE